MKKYFATLPTDEVAKELIQRKQKYYEYLNYTGRGELLRRAHRAYYRPAYDVGRVRNVGKVGEFKKLNVNHYRNLLQHRLGLTTNQRPHFEPKAANVDSKSQKQVALAAGLLEYYNRVKKMERFTRAATENAIVYGEGFIYAGWNATKGEMIVSTDEGGVAEGDAEFYAFNTFDAIRPVDLMDHDDNNWIMMRRFVNKYDLAAKYGPKEGASKKANKAAEELADRILGLVNDDKYEYETSLTPYQYRQLQHQEVDNVAIYTFFHRPTEAVPQGRLVELSAEDVVYHDGPLPYRDLPVYRITPGEHHGTMFGYSASFDLLPLQESVNKLSSIVLSNQSATGVSLVGIPKGSGVEFDKVAEGLSAFYFDAKVGEPRAINFTSTPAEIFGWIDRLIEQMETISGVNSVARGNPESSLKSGSALALVQSQAIQFAQGLQQSYAELLEDLGTGLVHLLQDYATTPRVALIAGKSKKSYLREFKSDDLLEVDRVIVDIGNPLNRTTAGKFNLAESLAQLGLVQNPEQFLEVLNTGKIEPVSEQPLSEQLLIRSENEELQEGKPQIVIMDDNHELHISEHLALLNNPEARRNPELLEVALAHIAEHKQALLAAQQPPIPPAPGQALEGQVAQTEAGNVADQLDVTDPTLATAEGVNLPNLPQNPLEGEQ